MSTSTSAEGSTSTQPISQTQLAQSRWESAQEKAFLSWVNSLLSKKNLKIENISTDFSDGTKLIYFLELVSNKKCRRKFNPEPKDKINRIQNITIALWFIEEELDIKIRSISSIGAEDFYDGNKKMIFGFLWSLYRKFRILGIRANGGSGGESSSSPSSNNHQVSMEQTEAENNLLAWCSNLTGMNVTQFKNGFKDGLAFLSMARQFSQFPSSTSDLALEGANLRGGVLGSEELSFSQLDGLEGLDSIARLNAVFDFAEKNLNIPKLLDAEDLVNGNADDRTVMLYTSMFYNAYEMATKKVVSKKEKSENQLLLEQVKELAEQERVNISKEFHLESMLNMYTQELSNQRFERLVMERMIKEQENQSLLNNLLLLRDQLEDHQIKLCKLQQNVQEEATGKRAPLWGCPLISADLSKDQFEQIQLLGDLLEEESNRINRIVQVSEVKPISFLKNKFQNKNNQIDHDDDDNNNNNNKKNNDDEDDNNNNNTTT
ncbi:hypothetical protein DDB_G0294557 [Dictyostelium discoideum AX4]|uniref:Calponin-homology (CH) domain-containing protein n=1 Tax=Dictyostelium discoideum TaxID=44689 RepID=Q1ZXJ2_DICDI|nr:hypothetical protein DDB_G0294557 [Dictyostelium discoideum AX4]EAS66895.2 hypothetical protein DDB_G0294557 [Dictyostelium discoideum AX4]|eukprot:XP_001134579.2 hypothetical protein DDB_G0294557 [Dictyostelium discoideum AX4]